MKTLIILALLGYCTAFPGMEKNSDHEPPLMPPLPDNQTVDLRSGDCASIPYWMSNSRIVGGSFADAMIPWQVYLDVSPYMCGGTIIDKCTILTARHCEPKVGDSIRAGSRYRTSGGQVKKIKEVINSPLSYYTNNGWTNNDWVILKLEDDLSLNNNVQPSCLPSSSYYLPTTATKDICYVSGWGGAPYNPTTKLKYVETSVITNSQCKQRTGLHITSSMICTNTPGEGQCGGDSGGPIVCDEGGKATLVGLVSFGDACPNIHTEINARVTKVLSWIKSNMGCDSGDSSGGSCTGTCYRQSWKGDDWCDDGNNNCGCDWDGGDCCGSNVRKNYCSVCACLDPNY